MEVRLNKKRKIWLLFVFVLLLSGCAVPASGGPLPTYVVILTPAIPYQNGRCTGVAIDAWHVLTAEHCFQDMMLDRVFTQYGQEAFVTPVNRWPELDAAVLRTHMPLLLPEYAQFAAPDPAQPAEIFGGCEFFILSVPRRIYYVGDEALRTWQDDQERQTQRWQAVDLRVCGGDSGGPVIQDGKVVGITHAVLAEVLWIPYGTSMYLIPANKFVDQLEEYQATALH